MSDAGQVCLSIEGAVASIVFDRPAARNAMTWAMYEPRAPLLSLSLAGAALRPRHVTLSYELALR